MIGRPLWSRKIVNTRVSLISLTFSGTTQRLIETTTPAQNVRLLQDSRTAGHQLLNTANTL